MRTLLPLLLSAALAGCIARAEEPAPKRPAIAWHRSFTDACAQAKAEGKLVLLLQLHGDFEKELC
jgi:hypothetical protein